MSWKHWKGFQRFVNTLIWEIEGESMQGDLKELGWDRRGDRLGWEGLWLTFTPLVTLGQGHGKVAFSHEIFFLSFLHIQYSAVWFCQQFHFCFYSFFNGQNHWTQVERNVSATSRDSVKIHVTLFLITCSSGNSSSSDHVCIRLSLIRTLHFGISGVN